METITHNLIAITIQILCFQYLHFPLNIIFTVILAFSSHFLSDALSKITYHTPEVMKQDYFWWIWHIFIYIVSITSILIFFIPFGFVIFVVNLPDIVDWFILRPIQKRKKRKNVDLECETRYVFHHLADLIRNKAFFWLPDLTYIRYGIITELLVVSLFSSIICFLI
ncbi:MAG: hypothetical protein ACW986_08575 [Promethearchaeota archaeon]